MNNVSIITYQPVCSPHWHGSTNIHHTQWKQGQKHRPEMRCWCSFLGFLTHTVRINAQRQNNNCCSICRHSHEVAHKHQKSSERKIKRRNHAVARNVRLHMARPKTIHIYYVYGLLILIKITLVKRSIRVSRNVKVHCNKIHGLLTDNVVIR